jgi:hypothetical protein
MKPSQKVVDGLEYNSDKRVPLNQMHPFSKTHVIGMLLAYFYVLIPLAFWQGARYAESFFNGIVP